ncbi:penicillin acylase family protein [Oceanimonas sp. NS1]|nr:penicillin acylase family protein [Oceanimonas sp. NS1]
MVEFGHNGHISWGSTWGAGDNVDLFRLELNPDHPEQYLYKGKYRPLEKEQQRIRVKDSEDMVITVYRSVYGPVVEYRPEDGVAYAKQRGWAGKEVSTLMAWNKVSKAKITGNGGIRCPTAPSTSTGIMRIRMAISATPWGTLSGAPPRTGRPPAHAGRRQR